MRLWVITDSKFTLISALALTERGLFCSKRPLQRLWNSCCLPDKEIGELLPEDWVEFLKFIHLPREHQKIANEHRGNHQTDACGSV